MNDARCAKCGEESADLVEMMPCQHLTDDHCFSYQDATCPICGDDVERLNFPDGSYEDLQE